MHSRNMLILATAFAVAVMALAPGTSQAQRPVYKGAGENRSSFDNPKVVDDSVTKYAYYAELAQGRPDIYQIYAQRGQLFNASLMVPQSDDLKTFAPSMALIGPGIGKPATSIPAGALPVKPPTSTGVLIADFAGDPATRPSV